MKLTYEQSDALRTAMYTLQSAANMLRKSGMATEDMRNEMHAKARVIYGMLYNPFTTEETHDENSFPVP